MSMPVSTKNRSVIGQCKSTARNKYLNRSNRSREFQDLANSVIRRPQNMKQRVSHYQWGDGEEEDSDYFVRRKVNDTIEEIKGDVTARIDHEESRKNKPFQHQRQYMPMK